MNQTTPPADRAALSARLMAAAEPTIVAEWICCDPIDPTHQLCVQGDAALRMVRALLVDDSGAWNPAAPLLDAVLAELEAQRLALSEALGLGTSAPWDAIRARATELAAAGTAAAAVRAKHKRRTERHGSGCVQCGILWPCPTYLGLEVAEQPAAEEQPETQADRGAVLLEIATTLDGLAETDVIRKRRSLGTARRLLAGELRKMAAEQPDGEQQCSARPCNPAADELCDRHAQIRYHAEGEHAFCEPGCDTGEQL